MCPPSDPAGCLGPERAHSGKELQQEPISQDDEGRDGHQKNEEQCKHPGPGVEEGISAHHPGNGTTGAHCGKRGMKIKQHVKESRTNPADEIEKKIGDMAEEIFHVVAEYPKKKHIARDVGDSGVEKHACKEWVEGHSEAEVAAEECGNPRGDGGMGDEESLVSAGRKRQLHLKLIEVYRHVRENEENVHNGVGTPGVKIFERDKHT